MNAFKILVMAIAAMALIYVAYTFMPFFFPTQDAFALLSNNIEGAQISQGKAIMLDIFFNGDTSINAENFDSRTRSTAFECNDPRICCNENEECGLIEWDARRIYFNSGRMISTGTRCALEENLFVCKIYFGKEPAQVKLEKAQIKPEIALQKESAMLTLEISNSGKNPIFFGEAKIEVFQKYFEDGMWKRRYSGKASTIKAIKELLPGEKTEIMIPLNIDAGSFEAEITAKGSNAGFDKNTVAFSATGNASCIAKNCETPAMEFSECKTTCYCEGCMFYSECEVQIKSQSPENLGLETGIALGTLNAENSSSNAIEFILDSKYCN